MSYCSFNLLTSFFFFLHQLGVWCCFFFEASYDKLLFCKKPFSSVNYHIICPCEFFFKTILREQVSHKKNLTEDNILYIFCKNKISHDYQSFLNYKSLNVFFLKKYVGTFNFFFVFIMPFTVYTYPTFLLEL